MDQPSDQRPAPRTTLRAYLAASSSAGESGAACAAIVAALAEAARGLAGVIATGPLAGITDATVGTNFDGDAQKELDVVADQMMHGALVSVPVTDIVFVNPRLIASSRQVMPPDPTVQFGSAVVSDERTAWPATIGFCMLKTTEVALLVFAGSVLLMSHE